MKYIMLAFILLVSISAYTANTQKMTKTTDTTEKNPPTAKPKDEQRTQLDDLIRGELSAMKAYDQALTDVKDENQREKLMKIRNDHARAASVLSKDTAAKPELLKDVESAGPWGTFAKTWTKGRGLTGNEGAVKALRQGEQHGINEYEEALKDESISNETKEAIKAELLPNQKKHIQSLQKLI